MWSIIQIISSDDLSLDILKSKHLFVEKENYLQTVYENLAIKIKIQKKEKTTNIDSLLQLAGLYPDLKNEVEKIENILILEINWLQNQSDLQYLNFLKFIQSLNLQIIYVFDEASLKILTPTLINYFTNIDFAVKNDLLYTYHSVENNDAIWFHTHGLNRFNLPEIEIFFQKIGNNPQNIMQSYLNLLTSSAANLIYENHVKSFHLNQTYELDLINIKDLNLSKLPYFTNQKPNEIATQRINHSNISGYLVYQNNNQKLFFHDQNNQIFDQINLPMFYFSPQEQIKAEYYAKKTMPIFEKSFTKKYGHHCIKALFTHPDSTKNEFMWVEVKKINDQIIDGILLNTPYYVDLKAKDFLTIEFADIVDWIIYFEEFQITPSNAYLLTN